MESQSYMPSTIGQASSSGHCTLLIFGVFGGVGTGTTALLWNLFMIASCSDLRYAVIFGDTDLSPTDLSSD